MRRFSHFCAHIIAVSLSILIIGSSSSAGQGRPPAARLISSPQFMKVADVAMVRINVAGTDDDLALIVGTGSVRLMTLDPTSGRQMGPTVDVALPPNPCKPPSPNKGIISKYFMPGNVVILNQDLSLFWMPVALEPDGTPVAGAWDCVGPLDAGSLGTQATTMAEMPGSQFRDGKARLYIGCQDGRVLRVALPNPGPPTIEAILDILPPNPIVGLVPIPQVGYIALGAMIGETLFGMSEVSGTPTISFELTRPPNPCLDLGVFESLEVSPNPVLPIHLLLSTGQSPGPPDFQMPANASGVGSLTMVSVPPSPIMPPPTMQFALGSLLYVSTDSTGVYYDPGFIDSTGFSSCIVNLTGGTSQGCSCCLGLTGNIDCDPQGNVDISDLSALIDNLYISFSPLCCREEANVDGQPGIDISDLSALIDYLYISFTPPAYCQ